MYLTECQKLLECTRMRVSEETVYFGVFKTPARRISDGNQP